MNKHPTKTRSVLITVLGFWLGAFLGNVGTYLIGKSGLAGWLLGMVPQDQSYVRLFFGILLDALDVPVTGLMDRCPI